MRLEELAALVGGRLHGDGAVAITGAAGLREARPGEISFLSRPRYAHLAAATAASALLVREPLPGCPLPQVVVRDPEAAMTRAAAALAPPPPSFPPGVHPSASVDPSAVLGEGVSAGPLVVIEAGARVGARSVLRGGSFVGRGAVLGEEVHLHPGARVLDGVLLGNRVVVGASAVIGCDGFGFLPAGPGKVPARVPHHGTVVVGDDVDIGACTTVARARFGRTTIGRGAKIDAQVQVAHNVQVGEGAILVSQVGLAGSTVVGPRAIFGGQAGASGHVEVGEGARVAAGGGVTRDIPPGTDVAGFPAIPLAEWRRQTAALRRLPEALERIRGLEREDPPGDAAPPV
ncbi:MAG: UDP-3-O-(3-hydroxymyristoyl)glucosamine N-acyltransferase [Planctomycetes bacterium]|nr:UDP-3-O-(3-hydroxymyristoyl)glucosamine N-acyltransferase [Planctomycetota bacterium]